MRSRLTFFAFAFLFVVSTRGSFSLEVVTTFLALKLAEPEGIFLTRGNHESKNMNKIYGFEGEVSPVSSDSDTRTTE